MFAVDELPPLPFPDDAEIVADWRRHTELDSE